MTKVGTPHYMAPEVYERSGHGFGVDWWAIGVMIFEMMFGTVPFYSKLGKEEMERKICACKVIFPSRQRFPDLKYSD